MIGNGPCKPICRAIVKRDPAALGLLDDANTLLQVWQRSWARQLAGRTVKHAIAARSREREAASVIGNDAYAIAPPVILHSIAHHFLDLMAGDQLLGREYADVKRNQIAGHLRAIAKHPTVGAANGNRILDSLVVIRPLCCVRKAVRLSARGDVIADRAKISILPAAIRTEDHIPISPSTRLKNHLLRSSRLFPLGNDAERPLLATGIEHKATRKQGSRDNDKKH